MENMDLYALAKSVPSEAKKTISAGRLKGFTDINPMWRIKRLTEMFGPCGIGWWYTITDKRLEEGKEGEIRAFVDIDLFYTWNGQTSKAVPGTGGSSFVTQEKNGAYVSDECFKMALTDAISVAAKSIGVGADVYYDKDRDKYTMPEETPAKSSEKASPAKSKATPAPATQSTAEAPTAATAPQIPAPAPDGYWYCSECGNAVTKAEKRDGGYMMPKEIVTLSSKRYGKCLCAECIKKHA